MFNTINFLLTHPLARKNRLGAIKRFVQWQVASRILPVPMTVPFFGHTHLVIERGMTGATGNYYVGLHEFVDMAFALHYLRAGDVFVDVGANVGSYSILASGVAKAKSIAYEPVPTSFNRLTRNIRSNGLDSLIEAKNCALGDSNGKLRFSADRDTMNSAVDCTYAGSQIELEVRRLDDTLHASPCVMKVDVEGYELSVLDGAKATLADPSLVAVLLENNSASVQSIMLGVDFRPCEYDPWNRSLVEKIGNNSANQLWIRDIAKVKSRLLDAPVYAINGVQF